MAIHFTFSIGNAVSKHNHKTGHTHYSIEVGS
jgi:hypothetical protein